MGVVTRAKKRKLEEVDHISGLPDYVLGDIVALLPTKDGARTQLLSSRWRPIWRAAAPLNVDLHLGHKSLRRTPASDVRRILSAHPGPGRRFSVHIDRDERPAAGTADLDGWLRSPALDNLHELEIHSSQGLVPLQLPASLLRFSPTLRVASFQACVYRDQWRPHQWPLLKQLTLSSVTISESSLLGLLAGCPALESLLLLDNYFCPRFTIRSPSLRSIGVCSRWGYEEDDDHDEDEDDGYDANEDDNDDPKLLQLVIEDTPCLERLLLFQGVEMEIKVVSAPRLRILGEIEGHHRAIQFGTRGLQGSSAVVGLMAVGATLRVLALSYVKPCLAINLIKCFPHLEKLHVEITDYGQSHESYNECWTVTNTLGIRLRKVVLGYSMSLIDFAKFIVMNASLLESITLELKFGNVGNNAWIRRQHSLLQMEKRASRDVQFDFVSRGWSSSLPREKQVHDLSIPDPFERI